MPKKFSFLYHDYLLEFSLPEVRDSSYGEVTVTVLKDLGCIASAYPFTVDQETFTRVATLSLLRKQYPERHLPHYLDDNGIANCGDINPDDLDFRNLEMRGFYFNPRHDIETPRREWRRE